MSIRVLVVDDSALMRKMIPQILASDPDIEVVGTAMDGAFALEKIRRLKPDVITLDVDMPRMDGIETLRTIVREFGTPTVMVSSLTRKDADLTFKALEIGAFDFVMKPNNAISAHIPETGPELIEKIRGAFRNARSRRTPPILEAPPPAPEKMAPAPGKCAERVLAIGVSTGGPNALTYLLPRIPGDFPAGIVIAQHMPAGFTGMFAMRLNALCSIEVKEAGNGDLILPGRALVAPGNNHLKIRKMPLGTIAVLSDAPPENGHRPSADVLFRSAAEAYGSKAAGLIMTGMGTDGSDGIGEIRKGGGLALAQDEGSCVVFGMPGAAVEKGNIDRVLPLEAIGDFLISHFSEKEDRNNGKCICT